MRLFIAIKVPPELHAHVAQAATHLHERMGVRPIPPDSWHMTLRFIGEAGEDKAKRISEALSAVKFSPFSVHLSGAGAYPNAHFPRAIYIGGESEGAKRLADAIEAALSPFGLQPEKFSVHVTVARSKGAGDIEDFLKKAGEIGSFEVKSFALMKSTLMAHEAAYEVLREYRAQG